MSEEGEQDSVDLSVVVPFFDEQEAVEPFFVELCAVLDSLGDSAEIIAVDDGSRDATFDRLRRVFDSNSRVRVLRLRRNFGQTAALAAGFAVARGRIVLTMDGDLQNDPADIPGLLRMVSEGYDVVSGWRRDRQDDAMTRILPSRIANGLISWVTGLHLHDYGCGIKAYRRSVVEDLRLYGEMHRFLPAIAADAGAKVGEWPVNHRPRTTGNSKYGLTRTVRVILDLVTVKFLSEFSTRPIQIFGLVGLILAALGGGLLGYLGIERIFFGIELGGRPIVLLAIVLLVTGLQFITFGLLGEMLARTYHESQGKPVYRIGETLDSKGR